MRSIANGRRAAGAGVRRALALTCADALLLTRLHCSRAGGPPPRLKVSLVRARRALRSIANGRVAARAALVARVCTRAYGSSPLCIACLQASRACCWTFSRCGPASCVASAHQRVRAAAVAPACQQFRSPHSALVRARRQHAHGRHVGRGRLVRAAAGGGRLARRPRACRVRHRAAQCCGAP